MVHFGVVFRKRKKFSKNNHRKEAVLEGKIKMCIREEDLVREEENILVPLKLNIKPIHSDKN
jgi:hypothetical protein